MLRSLLSRNLLCPTAFSRQFGRRFFSTVDIQHSVIEKDLKKINEDLKELKANQKELTKEVSDKYNALTTQFNTQFALLAKDMASLGKDMGRIQGGIGLFGVLVAGVSLIARFWPTNDTNKPTAAPAAAAPTAPVPK